MKRRPDVIVENHGSLYLFTLKTKAARTWVDTRVAKDAQFFAGKLVVEPRYAGDLAEGMVEDGLTVQ